VSTGLTAHVRFVESISPSILRRLESETKDQIFFSKKKTKQKRKEKQKEKKPNQMINEYFRTNKQKNFQRKSNGRSEKIPSTISLRPPPSLSSLSPLHHVPTMQNQLQTKHSTFLSVPKSMRKNQKEQVNDAAE